MTPPRIAYFINQHPKISHTFITREILGLERYGIGVLRIALRGWDAEVLNADDKREQSRTMYVLQRGVAHLFVAMARVACTSPLRFFDAFTLALRMSWRADRALPYHLIYFAEACQTFIWLRSAGITHVHAHFGTNSTEVVMLVHALGGPTFSFTVHGPLEFDKPRSLGLDRKMKEAAFVVAISSYGRSQLYRLTDHANWCKIQVIRCGLDRAFYDVVAEPVTKAPRMVCVGRLCEQKGHLILIEAARRLATKEIPFELLLIGDGELRDEIERLISKHSLTNLVRMAGWMSSEGVRRELLHSRGLVMPSFAEGLPVAIVEAMALRRAVVATYIAGIPELVIPGQTGWLVPAGDPQALAEAMAELICSPADRLDAMGDAGRARAIRYHDVDEQVAQLAALFRDPLGDQRPEEGDG